MTKTNQKGFSLVELLVVVAIIGILAAVGVVTYNGYISGARVSAAKATHSGIVAYATAESAKCSINQGENFAEAPCVSLTNGKLIADALAVYVNKTFEDAFTSSEKPAIESGETTKTTVYPDGSGSKDTAQGCSDDETADTQPPGKVLLVWEGEDGAEGDTFQVITCFGGTDDKLTSADIGIY